MHLNYYFNFPFFFRVLCLSIDVLAWFLFRGLGVESSPANYMDALPGALQNNLQGP